MASENFTNLEKSILKTLAFFDIFDYPLTLVEIHKWLWQPDQAYQLSAIAQTLDSGQFVKTVQTRNGFYFLSGRQDIVKTRLARYLIAEKKFKIALKTVRCLRWLAFVKMVAICNNVGYGNGTDKSDIDFFIVVRRGRLWWSRLLITLITTFLGVRRHDLKVVDRVCLSFYTSDSHLDLSDISLKSVDPYLVYWLATLAPIYDAGVYQELFDKNNWLKKYLPNFYPTILSDRRLIGDNSCTRFSKKIGTAVFKNNLGNFLESLAKSFEIKRVKKYFGNAFDEEGTNVIISSSMLKLHKTDRRKKYKDLWSEKLNSLGII